MTSGEASDRGVKHTRHAARASLAPGSPRGGAAGDEQCTVRESQRRRSPRASTGESGAPPATISESQGTWAGNKT